MHSFTDAKLSEKDIKDFLDVDSPKNFTYFFKGLSQVLASNVRSLLLEKGFKTLLTISKFHKVTFTCKVNLLTIVINLIFFFDSLA